jgi:AbrB family looped-hinge helix DNA binding protein
MNIDIVRLSSKGQIVIPVSMRDGFQKGDELVVIKDNDRLVIRKAEDLSGKMKDDLEFARRTEEAWQRIENKKFITQTADEFLTDLRKC